MHHELPPEFSRLKIQINLFKVQLITFETTIAILDYARGLNTKSGIAYADGLIDRLELDNMLTDIINGVKGYVTILEA